jgi:DNA mismatch endonuclease (patch repair protein)
MRRIRSKGMHPEMEVRRLVHRLGYRYRLHVKSLPGKPDLVFKSRRKIILVHGCFWHQHRDKSCKIVRRPKSNLGYWRQKLHGNVARDAQHAKRLRKDGWDLLTLWECQTQNAANLAQQIATFLG